jgi:dCTP deaminase
MWLSRSRSCSRANVATAASEVSSERYSSSSRSSIGRLGLFIENAGLVDRGFTGELTLEFYNPMPYDIQLVAGMRIGRLTFYEHDEVENEGYPLVGKYQGQVYPTESATWADEELLGVEEA